MALFLTLAKYSFMKPQGDEWKTPAVFEWISNLLHSYAYWTGTPLIPPVESLEEKGQRLYDAPFVVVSHNTDKDPVLNYGNHLALRLWEMDWDQFTRTPSRLTTEPVNQMERERMLTEATVKGYISDYRGIRISSSGRRFLVENAIVWTVFDRDRCTKGQAATFTTWTFL